MTKKRTALILIAIILIISLPFILGGMLTNCLFRLDFSGKCYSQEFSNGLSKGFNIFVQHKQEKMENKMKRLENNLNKIGSGGLIGSGLIR